MNGKVVFIYILLLKIYGLLKMLFKTKLVKMPFKTKMCKMYPL